MARVDRVDRLIRTLFTVVIVVAFGVYVDRVDPSTNRKGALRTTLLTAI